MTGKSGRMMAAAFALAAGTSYGFGGAVSQVVKSQGFEIIHIMVAQYATAAVILGVLVLVRFRAKVAGGDVLRLFGVGALAAISVFGYYFAIDVLSVGQAIAMQFQYVWIAVVIQSVLDRIVPGKWVVVSALLIIFGTVFGSGLADELLSGGVSMNPVGVAAAMLCAVANAFFIVMNGRTATEYPPVVRTFFMTIGSLLVALAVLPFVAKGPCDIVALIPGGTAMGLIMTVVPVLCIASAAMRLPGGLLAILTSSELPMGVIAGCLLLGETTTPFKAFGIAVIFASIVLSNVEPRKRV